MASMASIIYKALSHSKVWIGACAVVVATGACAQNAVAPDLASAHPTVSSAAPLHGNVIYVTRIKHRDREEDDKVQAHLEAMGLHVTMIDETAPVSDAVGADLVMISSVVSARDMVGTAYKDVKIPLLTWESDLFDSLRFTGARRDKDFGTLAKEHYVDVVNAPSPLAGGVSAGKHWVYPRDEELGWGRPAPGATVIATIPGEPRRAVLFAYEKGATMDSEFLAPARRVAIFLGNTTFEHLSTDGSAMFDAAVRWALGTPSSLSSTLPTVASNPS